MSEPLHTSLHRTAKYFMDNGRAASPDEALALLKSYGLTIVVGPEIRTSPAAQIALLTLVNLARRTFLGGIEVAGLGDAPVLVSLAVESTLDAAVAALGGRPVDRARPDWPTAVIGTPSLERSGLPRWYLTWEGWRAGVGVETQPIALANDEILSLSPALAASICAAEVFAYHAGDHILAGRRSVGFSLWRPDADWTEHAAVEGTINYLPSQLWLIGLGNLGQAYSWLLAALPYPRNSLEVVLQDFDRLAESNDSTSVLSSIGGINIKKTRWVADWLEARHVSTIIEERRFGPWTKRQADEPAVAVCGVDNPAARMSLEDAGFDLVVEAGLGAGPQGFRNVAMHCFPGARRAADIWPTTLQHSAPEVSHLPAYQALKNKGVDTCGLAQLASRTVGVPFVGMFAATLAISELLRRLNGGCTLDVVSGSVVALEDFDFSIGQRAIYDHGFVEAARGCH